DAMMPLNAPFGTMCTGYGMSRSKPSVPKSSRSNVSSEVLVLATWISEKGDINGRTIPVDEAPAAGPSPKVGRSPASQNLCSPGLLLETWIQPAAGAAGNNSLASFAYCPPLGIV